MLGIVGPSGPYGLEFCLKHALSLSLSLSPSFAHSRPFPSNLEAAELLKRVATSFWINMSLI